MTGKGGGKGSVDPVAYLGLEDIFKSATSEKRMVISIVSRTDELREKKKPGANKDELEAVNPESSQEEQDKTREWLKRTVGWTCNKGKKPEQANQDCLSILSVEGDFALYGVYDGHGPSGHWVSEFACTKLPQIFLQQRKDGATPREAFVTAFKLTQELIEKTDNIDAEMSGTTCTMAFHDLKAQKLWLSHVGDSRSIIGNAAGGKGVALTVDHKPDLPEEKARIERADPPGRVIFDGFFNYRVFAMSGMYPGLNMSRALGDCVAHKQAGLSAEPDIREVDLADQEKPLGGSGDRVLILCTDGVWEFIDDDEALKQALEKGIGGLADEGYRRWLRDSDNEISDDITGIMVRLKGSSAT
jgi:serine/threonine protein phosphatase PrpC